MGWFAIAVLLAVFAALALTRIDPAAILLSGLVVLVVAGAVKPAQALSGFGNTGLVTVAFLFVVAAALRETGASSLLVQRMLGANRSVRSAQARIIFPVTATSAFLNNTPVVAVLMPVVHDWARRHRVAVSKLLIPLSYASILGGMCTLIGTSTNLIVNGLYLEAGYEGIGLPACVASAQLTAQKIADRLKKSAR